MQASTSHTSHAVTVSTQSHDGQEESKRNFASKLTPSRWLCLPKQRATSSRTFKYFKMFLCVLFISMFFFEVTLNILCIKYYRDRVQDLRDSEIWPPRTRIQIESTNGHFFLFTTLMVGTAILIGILAIFMEHLILLAGYAYVHGIVTGFEIIGAWQSYDDQVVLRKIIGVAPEPIMVLLALIFANMCRKNERSLAKSPMFKQLMAAKAGKGETMSDPNHQLSQEDDDEKNNNKEKKKSNQQVSIEMEKGHVNDALDLSNDAEFAETVTSNSSASSYSSLSNEKKKSNESEVTSSVTVLMDGKTRISVSGHESPVQMKPVDLVDPVDDHEDTPEGDKAPCAQDGGNEQVEGTEEDTKVPAQGDARHSSVSSNEQESPDWCPSPSMSRKRGASVVGYEEKVTPSRPESKPMKCESKSSESRIL